jgi:hypothetical protein
MPEFENSYSLRLCHPERICRSKEVRNRTHLLMAKSPADPRNREKKKDIGKAQTVIPGFAQEDGQRK